MQDILYQNGATNESTFLTGSYSSIVGQTNLESTDNMYKYIAEQGGDLAQKYFSVLAKERYGQYKIERQVGDAIDKYTVNLNYYGSYVTTIEKRVNTELGSSLPSSPERPGYVFLGWYTEPEGAGAKVDSTTKVTGNVTYYAHWAPTEVPYKVIYKLQKMNDNHTAVVDEYEEVETVELKALTGTQVTPEAKRYDGFTAPPTQTVTVSGYGSTVVEYKYTRNLLQIILNANGGQLGTTSATGISMESNGDIKVKDRGINGNGPKTDSQFFAPYGGKLGDICNYNNTGYINIVREGHSVEEKKEWKTNVNGEYIYINQNIDEKKDMLMEVSKLADLTNESKTITLYVNWKPNNYYLDLNGLLDGNSSGNISGYGTVDVYINGTRVVDDVSDYWTQWPYGTTYEIKDINATTGHAYEKVSSGSVTGTVGAGGTNTNVQLKFKTNSFTANFNGNGGTDGKAITKKYGEKLGTLPTSTRTGSGGWSADFTGWYTSSSGGSKITTDTTMPAKNITYYAHWNIQQQLTTGEISPYVFNVTGGIKYTGGARMSDHYIALDGNNAAVQTKNKINTKDWTHCTVWVNGTKAQLSLYVGNTLVGTKNVSKTTGINLHRLEYDISRINTTEKLKLVIKNITKDSYWNGLMWIDGWALRNFGYGDS